MHLIKACPSCRKKLRFPIDKGTIKIRCSCGYSFTVDPDDTAIYKDATFDLDGPTRRRSVQAPLMRFFEGIKPGRIIPRMVNNGLKLKYKIQNYRLLPDEEKRKLVLIMGIIAAVIAGLAAVLYLIFSALSSPKSIIV
jgi:LSD1 subclass zinc finger protein